MSKKQLGIIFVFLFVMVLVMSGRPAMAAPAGLQARIAALRAVAVQLQTDLAAANANIAALQNLLSCVTKVEGEINGLAGPHFIFTGCNVHVRGGSGATNAPNGRGNLVVGYNEEPTFDPRIPGPGGLLLGDRDGSHNLIVGFKHRYTSTGGFAAGSGNIVSGLNSSVSGGSNNTASGIDSSVSGGNRNMASGPSSSVSGGSVNTASGDFSSVSGGGSNEASNNTASVSGGEFNTANGTSSSVSGGLTNLASGDFSSVSGGSANTASGIDSSVSGGRNNQANCFSTFNRGCTVGGGLNRTESRDGGWTAGDLLLTVNP